MADKDIPAKKADEEVEEIEVLDEADGTALPEAGASSANFLCCSSSCCSSSAG